MLPEIQDKRIEEIDRKINFLLALSGGDLPLAEYCRRFNKSIKTGRREIKRNEGMGYKDASGKQMVRIDWIIQRRNGV